MKNIRIKSLSILLVMPLSSYADGNINEYHFDSNLGYTRLESDFTGSNYWGVSLDYYWDPIIYSNSYPNKEVAFVNRLGSVGVRYRGADKNDHFNEMLGTNLGFEMRYAAKDFNHVFQISYDWKNIKYDSDYYSYYYYYYGDRSSNEDNSHLINFGYQYYLLENLTVGVGFKVDFIDNRYGTKNNYTYDINAKYLLDLGNEQWLALAGSYEYDKHNTNLHTIGASAEYYFTTKTSLKLEGNYEFIEADYSGDIGLNMTHYFVDQFSLHGGFSYQFTNRGDNRQYTIGASYRF
jgi:hypothetical protein